MKGRNYFAITALAAAVASSGALAQQKDNQEDMSKWAKAREKAIPADDILSGSVKNYFNPVGEVTKLILSEDHSEVEYVLFEVPYPYSFYTGEDGFVNFDSVEIDDDFYGVDVMITDANVNLPRDRLTLTRAEVDDRRIDNLIGNHVTFKDGETREIQDIMINPKTGKITHYVVEMNPDAIFRENRRAIRAKNITVQEDGNVVIDMESKDAEKESDIDPRYL